MARIRSEATDGEKRPSQKTMVLTALQELGMEARPQQIQEVIKSKYNVELPSNIISNYKSQIKREGTGNGSAGISSYPQRGGALMIEDFEAVRGLVRRLGPDQVKRLVDVLT